MKHIGFLLLITALPVLLLLSHLGLQGPARSLWLPLGLGTFTLGWAALAVRRSDGIGARAVWLAVWVVGGHMSLWLLFLLASFLQGQGDQNLGYALSAGVFTAATVGWYVLEGWLGLTLLVGLILTLALIVYRRVLA